MTFITFDDMQRALDAAKSQQQIVDVNVHGMAKLIANRLRSAGSMDWKTTDAMRALKRELRYFDSRTGRWKS